jgi:hypothetical protein
MLPLLAIAGSNLAKNLLQPAAAQGGAPAGQPRTDAAAPAEFQKFLQRVSASPEVQKASFLTSEGIHNTADAGHRLADYGARILQDPAVKKAAAGNSDAIEMRFLPGGSVCIKTSDGRETTVTLNGDAKEAARKASLVVGSLQTADRPGPISPGSTSKPLAPGINFMPGAGSASLLP